ncbi:hypothetical protein BCR44DRAFT_327280 [Catenaria anguillulae PL171]|uniref:Uncharacterized protein n=1 Tax=Catenaria anguillulae PL171 TaxID=765915 RepID=A0A1Y2I3L7_9FUNG|nr:hypothetical protein BCR44DRAFT_327280 [Catenaria anguillulae PL171]
MHSIARPLQHGIRSRMALTLVCIKLIVITVWLASVRGLACRSGAAESCAEDDAAAVSWVPDARVAPVGRSVGRYGKASRVSGGGNGNGQAASGVKRCALLRKLAREPCSDLGLAKVAVGH